MTQAPMTEISKLDLAHQQGDMPRFYQVLAQTPLFLLLEVEAVGETLTPRLFDLPTGGLVLAFDTEDRMASWAADMGLGQVPYAMLPGRIIAQQLAGMDLGLGLNFGSPMQTILPPEAMAWLTEVLDVMPAAIEARISQVLPPGPLPPALFTALDMGFATGLAQAAYLAMVRYQSGAQGHILAFVGATAHDALTRAVAEALAFSDLEAGVLDVTFVGAGSTLAQALTAHGRPLAIPAAAEPQSEPQPDAARAAPGLDPDRPPILR